MIDLERPRTVGDTELRTVHPGSADYRRWIDISADAYPAMRLATVAQRDAAFEEQRDLTERQPEHRVVGAYRAGTLVGGMRFYDFTMNVRGAQVFTAGLGSVAIALEHKRRGIARDCILGFLHAYRERGAALAALYPFRLDFYAAFGFGRGAKLDQYRLALDALPRAGERERVRRLGPADLDAYCAVYARAQHRANGLMRRERWRADLRMRSDTLLTFGYDDGGALRGYLTVEIVVGKHGTVNRNDLYVHEFVYETPLALNALLAFAASQRDQFATLVLNTQDPDLHAIFGDPRNGSDRSLAAPVYHETNAQGLGLMYRVLDAALLVRALSARRFGTLNATVRLAVADPLVSETAAPLLLRFEDGRPLLAPDAGADVDVALSIGDLSSLMMGAVRLRSLVAYGRAILSEPRWLDALDRAFDVDPPQCLTRF